MKTIRTAGAALALAMIAGAAHADPAEDICTVAALDTAYQAAGVTREGRAEFAGRLKRSGARQVKESDQMGSGGLIGHCIEASF